MTIPTLRRYLVSTALCLVVASACGVPEPVAEVTSALNGVSVPPPGGWGTEPWLCAGTWDPMNTPWPAHGWCQWQPGTTGGGNPWGVTPCHGTGPTVPGTMDLWSQKNYGGSCARITGNGTAGYWWDSDLIQVNGWLSIWTPVGGTEQFVGVKSIKVAPHTAVQLCQGPLTGNASDPCNAYISWGIATGPVMVGYPAMVQAGGLFFQTAALTLAATQ